MRCVEKMTMIDLEHKAAKCFKDFDTFWKELSAFREDYQFFAMYMKRNTKSNITFVPRVYLKSFQYVIDNYPHDDNGLAKAFCIAYIMKQIILDLQEWNTPVYTEEERNELLKYLVKYEWVDTDIFCQDFISCSHAHSEIKQKIDDILGDDNIE